jgi:hypothetical protein
MVIIKKLFAQATPEEESMGSIEGDPSFNRLGHRVGIGLRVRRLTMNGFIDFLTVHRNLFRSDDTETNLVAANLNDGDGDVIVDDNALVLFSGQY